MRLISYIDPTTVAYAVGERVWTAPARARLGMVLDDSVIDVSAAARALEMHELADDMLRFIAAGDTALATAREIARRAAELGPPPSNVQHPASAAVRALASIRPTAPIPCPQRNLVCVGLNYADHVAESRSVPGTELPRYPVFFTKPPTCVIGPDDEVPPHAEITREVDWEAELAVIIGRKGRDIAETEALDYVFGYTVANDITARDLQRRHGQWYKGKALDGFCPLGPAIVTADEIGDPQRLDIGLRVNGVEKQRSNTRHQIFGVARLIAEWSAGMTLLPGDILLTGTPSGVGMGRTPPEFLRPGDVVEAEVEGIGVLRNRVAVVRE
jgi:2-keto-4-pentenoate hydratase/2-oxohepta-3-ene-1,7-dioic acid hydratase in catechol pathway